MKELCEICGNKIGKDHPMCEGCGWINNKTYRFLNEESAPISPKKANINDFIEKFNQLNSCIKLKLESGGLARISPNDQLLAEDSKVVLSERFFDEVQRISKELNVNVVINSLQTTIRIEKE